MAPRTWTEQVEHDGLTFDVHRTVPHTVPHDQAEPLRDPVLLLHGFPQSARSWRAVATRLAEEGVPTAAPDQRGYAPGARPEAVEAYALPHLAADVLAVADAVVGPGQPFDLVGHDWGAAVAWWVAAHHGERVRTLTALSVPHLAAFGRAQREDPEQQRLSSYIGVYRRPGEAERILLADDALKLRRTYGGDVAEADVEEYVALLAGGGLTPALAWYRAMDRSLDRLPPVRVPTTYVWGDADLATSRLAAQWCGDHVEDDYRFVELPGVGHWTPDREPGVVAAEVLRRLRSVSAAPPVG